MNIKKIQPQIFSLMGSVKPKSKPEDLKKMRQKFIDYLSKKKNRQESMGLKRRYNFN